MSAADLLELSQLALGNMLGAFTIFMSIASGYLIVAYLVGEKLTRSQLWFINILFIVTMGLTSLTLHGFMNASRTSIIAARELTSGTDLPSVFAVPSQWGIVITRFVDIFIILGCLKFMWDVRHAD